MMNAENKKALETKECPKCRARLFSREVLDDRGSTQNNFFELFDHYGHSFIFSKEDLQEVKK